MIVYGDPQFTATTAEMLARVCEPTHPGSELDVRRVCLIAAGQLEQGIADEWPDSDLTVAAQCVTDACAAHFLDEFWNENGRIDTPVASAVSALESKLGARRTSLLSIKVPEGFAFYTLFPEQYGIAALDWLKAHTTVADKQAIVVGVRSIGTTLSAIVAQTLLRHGWDVQRLTARPAGHPYERQAALNVSGDAAFALVVDEGPGRSGSSMASVAEALAERGVRRICFLPGHTNGPGPEASETVRARWETTRQVHVPVKQVRWNGHTLIETLASVTEQQLNSPVRTIHDVSAGEWREFAFGNEHEWPPVSAAFERSKYLMTLNDRRRALWKFTGFTAALHHAISREPIQLVPSLCACHGFTMQPWIEGERLRAGHADDELLEKLADYIASAAQPAASRDARLASARRLGEMLFWNAKELLGEDTAKECHAFTESAISFTDSHAPPCYGDGRMAPHEFIRTANGEIFKSDAGGHDSDHTMVGQQSVLWDVAGTTIEWRFKDLVRGHFCEAMGRHVLFNEDVLRFYCAAYAAFRAGLFAMSGNSSATRDYAEALRSQLVCDVDFK